MNETHKVPALWGWPSNARPEMGGVRKRMRPRQTLGDVTNDAAEGHETSRGEGTREGSRRRWPSAAASGMTKSLPGLGQGRAAGGRSSGRDRGLAAGALVEPGALVRV